jgi:hypothetical protein
MKQLLKNKIVLVIFIILIFASIFVLYVYFNPYYSELATSETCAGDVISSCHESVVLKNINNKYFCFIVNGKWRQEKTCGIADCTYFSACYLNE